MVQEFHVVRCFKCRTFQVQQVKKVNRWICKLCGEKQSLLKEFGQGSAADCRRHVQKLNAIRGALMEQQEHHTWSLREQERVDQVSRWSKYLDPPGEEKNVLMDRKQLDGNNRNDRKRKRSGTLEQGSSLTPSGSSTATTNPTPGGSATTILDHFSPSSKNRKPPSPRTGPVNIWACSLSFDCQGFTDLFSKLRPPLPVFSMFESGNDFDEFL